MILEQLFKGFWKNCPLRLVLTKTTGTLREKNYLKKEIKKKVAKLLPLVLQEFWDT